MIALCLDVQCRMADGRKNDFILENVFKVSFREPARAMELTMSMTNESGPRRTMLLTGASRGIGHATVKRFSAAGWRVISCSRHAFPENCPWEMGEQDHIQIDLANPANTMEAIAEVKSRLEGGRLDALVNNAGISPKGEGGARLSTLDTSLDIWQNVFQVNFFAPVMLARGLQDELQTAKGSIVNVTSIAGSRVHPFAGAAYSTSKAALAALTREMASDFGPLGIRVNAISPGEIDTSILSPGTDKIVATIPMRRLGTPEEVAKAIYFRCTDQSSYVHGAEIHINGGQHV
jgi:short-subunit dehydrogenase